MIPLDELNPAGDFTIPRTVRSRVREVRPRRVCAITHMGGTPTMLTPATGEIVAGGSAIVDHLAVANDVPWLVATDDAGALYQTLEKFGPDRADYRAKGSIREARTYLKSGRLSTVKQVHAAFTDFRWGKHASALVLDPSQFSELPVDQFLTNTRDARVMLASLCLWAGDVLAWCHDVGLDIRAGRGGVAAQVLTDNRWWPDRRRKAPRRLNDAAREELPGNHYRLYSEENHPSAIEFDQRSAHHHVATRVTFTDSDHLHGFGYIGDRAYDAGEKLWAVHGTPKWDRARNWPGLFWLRVDITPEAASRSTPLPQILASGRHTIPVWSSELEDVLSEPGVTVIGIVGGILSRGTGDALNRYGAWALDQLESSAANPRRLRWLKPLLLATYGTMAQSAKPHISFSTNATANSKEDLVVLGGRLVTVQVAKSQRSLEPRYVNVTDRGIIEAETRAETIRVARAIEAENDAREEADRVQLVALYADSVLVAPTGARGGSRASDGIEHAEWARDVRDRVSGSARGVWRATNLDQLQMLAVNAYTSDQVTKRPGVARSSRAP